MGREAAWPGLLAPYRHETNFHRALLGDTSAADRERPGRLTMGDGDGTFPKEKGACTTVIVPVQQHAVARVVGLEKSFQRRPRTARRGWYVQEIRDVCQGHQAT